MAKSIKELQSNAENLMEQGRDAQNRVQTYTREVLTGQSRVVSAQAALDEASRTDENGNPKGDVMAAQAALSMARQMLAESRNHLEQARAEVRRVNRSKRDLASTLEGYSRAEKSNLEKLRELQKRAFGNSVNAAVENILSRFKLSEKIRVELLRSIGLDASEETESAEAAALRYEYGNEIIERSLGFAAERRVKGEDYIPPVSAPVGGGLSSVTAPPIAQGRAREPSAKAGQPSGQEKKTGSSRNSPPSAADALTPNTNDPKMAAAPEAFTTPEAKQRAENYILDFIDQNIRALNLPSKEKATMENSERRGTANYVLRDNAVFKIHLPSCCAKNETVKMTGKEIKEYMKERYKASGVKYNHFVPDFSPFVHTVDSGNFASFLRKTYGKDFGFSGTKGVKADFPVEGMTGNRENNMYLARAKLARELGLTALVGEKRAVNMVTAYQKANDLTWDEYSISRVRLIPIVIHDPFRHTGFVSNYKNRKAIGIYWARHGLTSYRLQRINFIDSSGKPVRVSTSQIRNAVGWRKKEIKEILRSQSETPKFPKTKISKKSKK